MKKLWLAAALLCVLLLLACKGGDDSVSIPSFDMVTVPAGTFQRDATTGNNSTITHSYQMMRTEVTQELWQAVMGSNPSAFQPSDPYDYVGQYGYDMTPDTGEAQAKRPVEMVSWYDVLVFCNKLSAAKGKTPCYTIGGSTNPDDWGAVPTSSDATWNGAACDFSASGYRLPTEMEWMWAAMGAQGSGTNTTDYAKTFAGDDLSSATDAIDDYAWYSSSSWNGPPANGKTHEVGKKSPNELGLLDMSGNVYEWCWDWYISYPSGAKSDYTGAAWGSFRVVRGGSWNDGASYCTVAYRVLSYQHDGSYNIGVRVVCP
jgi:formylglycine-generating enzyme required for sulfatase activity